MSYKTPSNKSRPTQRKQKKIGYEVFFSALKLPNYQKSRYLENKKKHAPTLKQIRAATDKKYNKHGVHNGGYADSWLEAGPLICRSELSTPSD